MEPELSTRPGPLPATPARRPPPPVPVGHSTFAPALLIAVAFVAWLGFQAVQQVNERQQLAALQEPVEQQEAAARKVRVSLDAVATAAAKLAADGNANARVVIEELRKRGITINANGAAKPP